MDAITKAHDSRLQLIDTSIVRVHQHGATAKTGVVPEGLNGHGFQ
jgi:hypothetical protein